MVLIAVEMLEKKHGKMLHEQHKCDILKDSKALSVLQEILDHENTAEVFVGKYGLVIREISRKTKYTH